MRVEDLKQAVILAGGIGSRLRPLTNAVPKPMVLVNNRPFLEYLIDMLKENGISEIVLLLGYLPEKITGHFGDGSNFGIGIKYSIGQVSDKTGTRIKKAEHLLDDYFLLMYGDNCWPLNLEKLLEFYTRHEVLASVTIYANKDGITRNNVLVNDDGYVLKYDKTRKDNNLNGVEIGFFIMNKKTLELMPSRNFSFEEVILPGLIARRQLGGYQTDHRYYSISTPEKLKLTEKFLEPKKVVFLDRDGVINRKPPRAEYVKRWEEFEFLPEATQALRLLTQNGYDICMVTNQAGIARGVMSEQDLKDIHEELGKELEKHDAKISAIYYCPHGWDDGCECRKPKPGLLYQAARDHNLDLTKTIFIGDDERDMQAGTAAGCKTILVTPGNNLLQIVKSLFKPISKARQVNYETLLNALLEAYWGSHKKRFLVLIGGCARAGKTMLAQRIQHDLRQKGIKRLIVSLDNWLLGINERRGGVMVRERFQYQKIAEVIGRIKEGEKVVAPLYDPKTRSIISKQAQKLYLDEGVIIADGVVALDIEALRSIADFMVFVDIDDEIRKEKLKHFYIDYKKCSPEETKVIIESREVEEVPTIKKTMDYADVVFASAG
ncbi:HAD-IIIA family hydrolase [Chloroflexota bacterium]